MIRVPAVLTLVLAATPASTLIAQLQPPPPKKGIQLPNNTERPTTSSADGEQLQRMAPLIADVRARAVPIRTIDPADGDFTDLEPLAKAIGDARIVAIGDPTYGDGTAFLAKDRLIRFLHQRMGFDVIAWESGMWDCAQADAQLSSEAPIADAAGAGIYPVWAQSGFILPLFEYVRESRAGARPIAFCGFDVQFLPKQQDAFVNDLEAYLDGADRAILGETRPHPGIEAARWLIKSLMGATLEGTPADAAPKRAEVESLIGLLDGAQAKLVAHSGAARFHVMRESIVNLLAYDSDRRRPASSRAADRNPRDARCAENLLAIADKLYPGRRIVVWAGAARVARAQTAIKAINGTFPFEAVISMGDVVGSRLKDDYFVILPVVRQGSAGVPGSRPRAVEAAAAGSVEDVFHRAGMMYAFLNLNDDARSAAWTSEPQSIRYIGYMPASCPPAAVADGILYLREMVPSTREGVIPPSLVPTADDKPVKAILPPKPIEPR